MREVLTIDNGSDERSIVAGLATGGVNPSVVVVVVVMMRKNIYKHPVVQRDMMRLPRRCEAVARSIFKHCLLYPDGSRR